MNFVWCLSSGLKYLYHIVLRACVFAFVFWHFDLYFWDECCDILTLIYYAYLIVNLYFGWCENINSNNINL